MARARESQAEALARWEMLQQLQETFPYTVQGLLSFAQVVINTLITGNPDLNRVQADILKFLFGGNKYRMVEAQRGQAKTTIAAIYAVFRIIHEPHKRIMIVSQTAKRAEEIAGWVIKIFRGLDFLEFMLPDIYAGDKASIKGFEVHYTLRGSDKSPSVACYSIEAGMQGARADIILADDVESLQNSRTAAGRALLEDLTKEFESINQFGDIIYLGTPQSVNSIYNNLPARGYQIRIWPGRYPTLEQEACYGDFLAPMIMQDIMDDPSLRTGYGMDGTQGAPTCPEMYDDEKLIEKEISQGTAKFQLQFMLNTRLMDADRYPLRLNNLIMMSFGTDVVPEMPTWSNDSINLIGDAPRFGNKPTDYLYRPVPRPYEWKPIQRRVMYIDPAGGGRNGDETGVAIVFLLGTFIYVYKVFGVPGGYSEAALSRIVREAKQAEVKEVFIEKNFGHGAFEAVIKPYFEREWPAELLEDYANGQKETRIIETLEPLLTAHRLIFNAEMIRQDIESVQHYPLETRMSYSLFAQMSNITLEKGCLRHDDRLDALYGAIRQLTSQIDYDEVNRINRLRSREMADYLEMMNDPRKRREFFTGQDHGASRRGSNMSASSIGRVFNPTSRNRRCTNTISSRISRGY
ncbi:MAG: phage terminase large subunit [Citrobacter telavivensis]